MEDLTAIIPVTFDFVDEADIIFDEDKQQTRKPSFGKCQSLFVTTQTSL
jgi:hypothetical protein